MNFEMNAPLGMLPPSVPPFFWARVLFAIMILAMLFFMWVHDHQTKHGFPPVQLMRFCDWWRRVTSFSR
jgi:hypothetical protein